ncbi:thiamine pyrophosphate-dependent enzyme [Egicoccus halophilus]|uniref:MFS transporter n=1 Tax=Egicoccus halophilus TaxID=1670830 RepID=A0A8J3ADE9_9ACTN|nr:thiamine pyrophosphate-dependent enzyme [Egicoccus halophilus]GGI09425.1 MFS transporter [Egicoccus halophilus]
MTSDRVAVVEAALDRALADVDAAAHASPPAALAPDDALPSAPSLTVGRAVALFEDMVRSRVLDVVARELKADGVGYYTISSAGHEANAVVGALLRPTDPCLLHYRSGGLVMARARQLGTDGIEDTLASLCANRDDPASGGRHKVWGSATGWIPPQTSTIASHLPKAVGAALAIGRAGRGTHPLPIPDDSVVLASFGDASANHASALTAFNSARWARRRGNGVPIVFLCEDNGIGISVPTPARWVETTFGRLPGLRYHRAEGELDEVWASVEAALDDCRDQRAPVFLHLPTVRLWGHAGSDVESAYRPLDDIRAAEADDPLLRTARRLLATGAATPRQLRGIVEATRARARARAPEVAARPRLTRAAEVVAPLPPLDPRGEHRDVTAPPPVDARARRELFGDALPEQAVAPTRRTMGALLNAALKDELLRRPNTLVFGEDVARKGGVYHVTAGLLDAFGPRRVFDTLLDETTVLGVAQGTALLGHLPVPEIQYLAYLHNALDQLRGEACSTSFFSNGAYRTPMVVRIAGLAYQKGFGGHFHNDHAIGALREIPGLVLAVPSRGDDAARMLRGCLALAEHEGRVVAFLEPIALYHERDLHTPGDGGWLSDYPDPSELLLPGEVGVHRPEADDVLLVTYGNGVRMSLRAAEALRGRGIEARVLDLRWLNPLPTAALEAHAAACRAVLVVDECRRTGGGIADAVIAALARSGARQPLDSVSAEDSYVPLGPAADTVLVDEAQVVAAAEALVAHDRSAAPPHR